MTDYRRDLVACVKKTSDGIIEIRHNGVGTKFRWQVLGTFNGRREYYWGRSLGAALGSLLRELKKRDGRKG